MQGLSTQRTPPRNPQPRLRMVEPARVPASHGRNPGANPSGGCKHRLAAWHHPPHCRGRCRKAIARVAFQRRRHERRSITPSSWGALRVSAGSRRRPPFPGRAKVLTTHPKDAAPARTHIEGMPLSQPAATFPSGGATAASAWHRQAWYRRARELQADRGAWDVALQRAPCQCSGTISTTAKRAEQQSQDTMDALGAKSGHQWTPARGRTKERGRIRFKHTRVERSYYTQAAAQSNIERLHRHGETARHMPCNPHTGPIPQPPRDGGKR